MNLQEARNILGVGQNASKDEIKKAYKRLAMKWHPDRHSDEDKKKEASQKFSRISSAHDILVNPQKSHQNNFQGFSSHARDWFNDRKNKYNPMEHGQDIFSYVKITLEESALGVNKKVKINKPCVCDSCKGLGMKEGSSRTDCSSCNGSGFIVTRQKIMGMNAEFNTRHNCPTCQGVGSVIAPKDSCEKCNGRKRINKVEEVDIEIPSGVRNGIKLGSNGLGGEGISGGRNGRLLIDIAVDEHEHYKIIDDTNDLRLNYNISYSQHYNGDIIEIKTIYGDKIDVKIPPCHNTIDPIVKIGYGLPSLLSVNSRVNFIEKGNLYIYLNVKGPEEKYKKIIEELDYKVENPIESY